MHTLKIAPATLCVCSALMIFATADAAAPVGPDAWRVDTAEDVSFVEEGLAVPANCGSLIRRGIFCPEGGPIGVSEVIWCNVKLSDIETFTGKISCKAGATGSETYFWKDAGCYHIVTNEAQGYVQCQLQVETGDIVHGFIMRYRQDGNDVKGELYSAKLAWTNVEGQYLGCDMFNRGGAITVTNTPYVVGNYIRAISDLGIVLRNDSDTIVAPEELVFASTDEAQSDEEEFQYTPYLTASEAETVICRNLNIYDITGISGEISSSRFNNGKWTPVQGYCLTNKGSYVQMNLVWQNPGKSWRIASNIRFRQYGADVFAYAFWAGYSYDSDDISAPIGYGVKGAQVAVTNEPNTTGLAIRNLKVRFRPKTRIVGDYEHCIIKEDGWVKIWPDLDISKAVLGTALMGGASANSTWNVASNYNRSVESDITTSYYQWYKSSASELYTIGFLMQQQSADVYAKILSARYNSKWQLGDLATGNYQTCVTNIVDGKDPTMHRTLAICHLTAEYPAKKRHTVTVGNNFDPGCVPVRLEDMKLALAPSAGNSLPLDFAVRGYGVVGASGEGEVRLGMDLPETVSLDVDSGAVVIDASRRVGGKVNVAEGAALKFVLATGVRPSLEARFFNIEAGAEIALTSESYVAGISKDGETFKLVTGCNYADYAIQGMNLTTSGLSGVRKARLFVDEDGDIAVEIKPKTAFQILVR